jgi:hypothetical protein
MKAALELGRWTFLAPIGYLNAPRAMGKSLIADPERATLVRRAFEEYATGRYTKEQLLKQARAWGLTNRRFRPLTSQAIGMLLRNQLYAGIVDVPEYGVRAKRGDFEPLISEDLFYRVQASLEHHQRFQQLFFPDGIAFDGKGFVGTRVTAPAFSYLRTIEDGDERLVSHSGVEPLSVLCVLRGQNPCALRGLRAVRCKFLHELDEQYRGDAGGAGSTWRGQLDLA